MFFFIGLGLVFIVGGANVVINDSPAFGFVCIAMGLWILRLGWGLRQPKVEPAEPKTYPRIVAGDGVWVEEIKDFDMAVVKTGPTTLTMMPMEDAKRIAVDAR
jgi:hypothetical protein